MRLSLTDADLYHKLHAMLLCHTNRHTGTLEGAEIQHFFRMPVALRMEVRDALWDNPHLIDSFVAQNPFGLPAEELALVGQWKHFVKGRFFLVRPLKKHSIFLGQDGPLAYGVLGLTDEIEDLLGSTFPSTWKRFSCRSRARSCTMAISGATLSGSVEA